MQKPPTQPSFPFMNVDVNQNGLVITTHLTAFSAFTQVIDRETLKTILPMIKESLKQEQATLALVRNIQESKL